MMIHGNAQFTHDKSTHYLSSTTLAKIRFAPNFNNNSTPTDKKIFRRRNFDSSVEKFISEIGLPKFITRALSLVTITAVVVWSRKDSPDCGVGSPCSSFGLR